MPTNILNYKPQAEIEFKLPYYYEIIICKLHICRYAFM